MSSLTDEQIDFITAQINRSNIESPELKEDLIDHFCCIIEDYMDRGNGFEQSYAKAYEIICPNGFDEIYQETLLLLTSKNIHIMKKLLYVLGLIATIFFTTSLLFKVLHWPHAGILLGIGLIVFIFILLPLIFLYIYKKEFSRYISYKLKYLFGYLGAALFLSGAVLKLLHWSGSELLLLLSVAVINFGFIPFYFYRLYRKPESADQGKDSLNRLKYIFGIIGVALFLTAFVFKMLHLPGANAFFIACALVLNFGFLPFLFYGMYKKSLG